MELKIFLNNNLIKTVFYCWWIIGKGLGLFPFYYNKTLEVYCQSLISQVYSAFIGLVAVLCYPYAFSKFYAAISVADKSIEIPFMVSIFNDWFMFTFMVTVYFLQLYNNKKIVSFYNGFALCAEKFNARFPEYSKTKSVYGFLFVLCFFLKIIKIFQYAFGLTFVTHKFRYRLVIIAIVNYPYVVSSIVSVQFFLGILFLWCHLTKIENKLECLQVSQMKSDLHMEKDYYEKLRNLQQTLELSDTLDELGIIYFRVYTLYLKLEDLSSIPMILMLGQIFISLVMQIFFQFLWILSLIFAFIPLVIEMWIIGIINIFFLICELKLYFTISLNCTKEVCFQIF